MNKTSQIHQIAWQKAWNALRFFVFAVGGFWLLIYFWLGIVRAGNNANIQRLTGSTAAQEAKQPIIYVKHLEPPLRYPPLARMTRVHGTVVMKLTISADGTVLAIESESALAIFKDDAEKIVKTWTFGCAGCPPNAPFEHTVRFNYKLVDEISSLDRVVMNLPDEVTISTGPVVVDHGGPPPKTSKKGSH
jgi:TonB family protein